MSTDHSHDPRFQLSPMQLKGEIMDFGLGADVDHRKRRRNRTTQSCLNCHTSKRKCDRKRPCQRCIQLGLTGICVYEVDDPALRDDPNLDESTRLRNRVAELESLVRELRGKPHPRWTEPNFCNGDAKEKWHSRSTKHTQLPVQKRVVSEENGHNLDNQMMSPAVVKIEPFSDASQHRLYRDRSPMDDASFCSANSSPSSGTSYHDPHPAPSSNRMLNNDLYYPQPYILPANPVQAQPPCACVANHTAGHTLISLAHQLQSVLQLLRQLPEHSTRHDCTILSRGVELSSLLRNENVATAANSRPSRYDSLPTSTETEHMSPVSTSSHSSMASTMPQQWSNMGTASTSQYDTYFSMSTGENGVYQKMYRIN